MKKYYCDYKTAIRWCHNQYIMLNDITRLDENFLLDDCPLDSEGNPIEFFQYFISDCSDWDVKYLTARFPELHFAYSEMLGRYFLCVDHWGTAWDYVTTKISRMKDESREDFFNAVDIIRKKSHNFKEV